MIIDHSLRKPAGTGREMRMRQVVKQRSQHRAQDGSSRRTEVFPAMFSFATLLLAVISVVVVVVVLYFLHAEAAIKCRDAKSCAGIGQRLFFIYIHKENKNTSSNVAAFFNRKLLQSGGDDGDGDGDGDGGGDANRIGTACSKDDIVIYQGSTAPLPNGIPGYTVQILNTCVSGCSISGIHVNCGWFSSARLVNPQVFKRLDYDDCLVNDGHPLAPGQTLSFQYANSFQYPLSVSSVVCPQLPQA